MKETEKNALQEKLNAVARDLQQRETDYEKLRREALSKQEQDRVIPHQSYTRRTGSLL